MPVPTSGAAPGPASTGGHGIERALAPRGWIVVEDLFNTSETDALAAALAARRWPRVTPEVAAWIRDARWACVVLPALGPDVRFVREQVVTKAPRSDAEVPWHQDGAYARIAGEFLTCFLALDDMDTANGCLWLLAGSSRGGLVQHVPQGYLQVVADPPDAPGEAVPLRRGSLVTFSSLTFHRSGPNACDGVRPAWMLQFAPGDVRDRATGAPAKVCPVVARGGRWMAG
jgi:ectoine hydroxylase-related dioxygenase (phytanoyl-CoA dioxygenase family)